MFWVFSLLFGHFLVRRYCGHVVDGVDGPNNASVAEDVGDGTNIETSVDASVYW